MIKPMEGLCVVKRRQKMLVAVDQVSEQQRNLDSKKSMCTGMDYLIHHFLPESCDAFN